MPVASGKEEEDNARRRLSESHEDEPAAMPSRGRKRGKWASSSTTPAAACSRMATRLSSSSSRIPFEGRMTRSACLGVQKQRQEPTGADEGYDEGDNREKKNMDLAQVVVPSDAALEEQVKATDEEQEKTEETSSALSSPLCQPYIRRLRNDSSGESIYKLIDTETFGAYEQSDTKFQEKEARQMELPTLKMIKLNTYLGESASRATIHAGKSVFSLSSSTGAPLAQCTGILVDWNSENVGTGIILTSANLILQERPVLDRWLCKDKYAPTARVNVCFLDKTTEVCNLLYLQKHYNIALFTTKMKGPVVPASFTDQNVNCGESVLLLGRDEKANIRISSGQVQHLNPNLFERHHFMHMSCVDAAPKCLAGGPVIDFDSKFLGISEANLKGSFVPSSIVLMWLHLWKNYRFIPRPHLQLKLCAIQFLDPAQIERILYECGIDKGLIVQEVDYGSMAEKNGIRVGDVVESFNGESITNLVQLEMMLLHLSQQHLEERNNDNSLDVELGLYHTRRSKRRTIKMTVMLTDEGENVARGRIGIPATGGERTSA